MMNKPVPFRTKVIVFGLTTTNKSLLDYFSDRDAAC